MLCGRYFTKQYVYFGTVIVAWISEQDYKKKMWYILFYVVQTGDRRRKKAAAAFAFSKLSDRLKQHSKNDNY